VQRLEEAQRAVLAAVVDEEKLDADAVEREAAKLVDGQPPFLVVAGDDQDQVHLRRAF
jgi:hypothetical protein